MASNRREGKQDGCQIQKDRSRRRQSEYMETVQNTHRERRQRDEEKIWKHDPVQLYRLASLNVSPCKQVHDLGGKDHSKDGNHCHNKRERPKKLVREVPDFFLGLLAHVGSEDWDEGSGHRSFSNQTAEQVGDAVRKIIGVGDGSRSEEKSYALLTYVAENSTYDSNQGDDRGRFEDMLFIGQRPALRDLTLMKTIG